MASTPKQIFAARALLSQLRTLRSQKRALLAAQCWDDISVLMGKLSPGGLLDEICTVAAGYLDREMARIEDACKTLEIDPDAEWPGMGDP